MDIQSLITKYNKRIDVIEKELEEIKRKRDVLQEALEMLAENKDSKQQSSPIKQLTVISDKYSNMTWPQALLTALNDNIEMTGDQLLKELFENGFQSNSKSIKSDMYGRLKTLENNGKIIATKEGKELTRYKIKQNEIGN
ncbi:MAG: hypothetical protein ISS65_07510 [Desulfobacterales bacterium]|nr:hypothetical protein [Desulfobacterales bacterium]